MGDMATKRKPKTKPVNLALQGGGAIGAFTWGVLDYFLEDGRLSFDAVSGTSAGAMNAVVLADGMERGGPEEARAQLARLWQGISGENALMSVAEEFLEILHRTWGLPGFSPYAAIKQFAALASPYNFNPFNYNPLIQLVESLVDFERVQRGTSMKVFISATNVRTGMARVFTGDEIDASAVMASACLPYLFQAVEKDGEAYWDGGYSGNPSLWPFFERPGSDIVLIQLDPMAEKEAPKTPQAIVDRIRGMTFNNPLIHDLRAMQLTHKLAEIYRIDPSEKPRSRIHRIDANATLRADQAENTLDVNLAFFEELRDAGREAALAWLDRTYDDLGVRDTVDLTAEFA